MSVPCSIQNRVCFLMSQTDIVVNSKFDLAKIIAKIAFLPLDLICPGSVFAFSYSSRAVRGLRHIYISKSNLVEIYTTASSQTLGDTEKNNDCACRFLGCLYAYMYMNLYECRPRPEKDSSWTSLVSISLRTIESEFCSNVLKHEDQQLIEVSKDAKIRNRYNQVPHLT